MPLTLDERRFNLVISLRLIADEIVDPDMQSQDQRNKRAAYLRRRANDADALLKEALYEER